MKKYNYYILREKIKSGEKLPEDINSFIHKVLIERKLVQASNILKEKEQCGAHGKTIAFKKNNPMLRIEFNVSFGMVEGFDIVKELFVDNEIVLDVKHIKNPFLDMKKMENEK